MARASAPWSTAQRRIAALVLPVVLVDLGLQIFKTVERFSELAVHVEQMGALDWLAFLGSPFLFHAGFALGVAGLVLLGEGRRFGWLGLAVAQILSLLVLFDELASFSFFMRTSAPLRFEQVLYWTARPADLRLVAAVVTPARWLGVLALTLGIVALPWLARRRSAPRRTHPPAPALGLIALGLLAGLVGILPLSAHAADFDVARDPFLELLTSAASHTPPPTTLLAPRVLEVERTDHEPQPNVVIVLLESTRAISIQPWGALPTMPFLAALAEKSLRVERAYTVIPHTSKALVATLCGLEPSHRLDALETTMGMLKRCLPALLKSVGYRTAFFQAADPYFEGREGVTQEMGFEQFSGATAATAGPYLRANFVGFEDDVMLEPSRRWLTANPGVPKLAVYLTVAPHHECYVLKRYGRVEFDPRPDVNNYLNNVREEDFFIKNLIEQYQQLGLYQNTLFLFLGDHGEAFGEHGRRAHDGVPYEETLRVPMVLHDPTGKRVPAGVLPGPVSEIDVVPELLEVLGLRVTAGKLWGAPFGKRPPDGPIYATCFGERDCLVDLHGTRKLLSFYDRRPDELYDLRSDPGEQHNLLGPATAAEAQGMREELRRWEQRVRSQYWGEGLDAPARR